MTNETPLSFLNEARARNAIGKTIKFDVQPYAYGEMVITKVFERKVEQHKVYDPEKGGMLITYNVFDIEGDVIKGREIGGLICGVPIQSTIRDLEGKTYRLVGLTTGDLNRCAWGDATFIQASCG